jgi:hypothetical protein
VREGRALWRWAQENSRCVKPDTYLDRVTGEGQEHRVWHSRPDRRYWKATHAGRYGWTASLDLRFNKRTQEDEPYIGMGDATPLEYLERLALQNEVFADDICLRSLAIESEGLVILTTQPFIRGSQAKPPEILAAMGQLGFERIPGIPANTDECFSFYRRRDRVSAFDAHNGNFIRQKSGLVIPIDLVMVRADEAMHEYLGRRIEAAKP